MKINRVLLLGLVLVKSVFVAVSQERCVPVGMLCEYLSNPLGIDALHPRLRWHLDDVRDKAMQKACRVLVSTDSLKLADKNYADCWDTGKRKTETMQFVYNGKTFESKRQCCKVYGICYRSVMSYQNQYKCNTEEAITHFIELKKNKEIIFRNRKWASIKTC